MSPFKSEAQRAWGNSPAGMKALGGRKKVDEWNQATAGRLPARINQKVDKYHKTKGRSKI